MLTLTTRFDGIAIRPRIDTPFLSLILRNVEDHSLHLQSIVIEKDEPLVE